MHSLWLSETTDEYPWLFSCEKWHSKVKLSFEETVRVWAHGRKRNQQRDSMEVSWGMDSLWCEMTTPALGRIDSCRLQGHTHCVSGWYTPELPVHGKYGLNPWSI